MSAPLSDLSPASPAALPVHLYGTRAALFYLLRDAAEPGAFEAAPRPPPPVRPTPPVGLAPPPRPVTGPVLVQMPTPVTTPVAAPASQTLRDMLMSDSFDFRGFGEAG